MSSANVQQMLFERIVNEFGGDNFTIEDLNTRCGLNDQDLKSIKSTKTKEIPEEHQCLARIWDKDCDDKRCSKRRVDGKWFCAGHGRPMLDNSAGLEFVWQKCGRIDEDVPKGYRAEKVKKERKPKKKVEQEGIQKPKKALTSYFCFMNAKRQQVKDENPNDKVGDISKKLGEMWKSMGEEEKKPFQEVAAKDKERHLKEMEEFLKSTHNVGITPPPTKVEIPAPKVDEFDQMDKNKDGVIDKQEWEQHKMEQHKMEEEEVDEDEVAVVEYKYKGTTYLLDPESKKVYNIEQEFVGKLEKKKINFDALDSDDEE